MSNVVQLRISNILGFYDLNGVEAMQLDKVQELEELISACNVAHNNGEDLVPDAIWDRMMEILRQVNPDSELCKYIWEDSVEELDDSDAIVRKNPMYSIQTVKSFDCDEIKNFVSRLPDDKPFEGHISVKLNGHGIRLKYKDGEFFNARSRARASAGRDITEPLRVVLENLGVDKLVGIEDIPLAEVRGEWVLPFSNLEVARQYNPEIVSAFSGVASMGRASASREEWGLLHFVAYEFLADGVTFSSKSEEYEFLEELGFEVPLNWQVPDLTKSTLIEELKTIVSECEEEVAPDADGTNGYAYYTDGLVFAINDTDYFKFLGDDGSHYKFGNMALKVGYWQQDMYYGYIQTIMWMKGKTKLTPVAIISDVPDLIEFKDFGDHPYVIEKDLIANYDKLGVITASGNKVRRVPLYEPRNLVVLNAYPGNQLYFRYGGEAGVVPCFENGKTLIDGRVEAMLNVDYEGYDYEYDDEDY